MKNQFFLMIIFCSISTIVHPMSLDKASEVKLIEQVKKENVERKYWPSDAVVTLEEFYKMSDNNAPNPRYFVRACGRWAVVVCPLDADPMSQGKLALASRGAQGSFDKKELESFGVQLPE